MAKLSARGRKEVFRVSKKTEVTDPSRGIHWEKLFKTLMTDGTILEKRQVLFVATEYSSERLHDWGWKVVGKLKPTLTADDLLALYTRHGFTKEK